MGRPLFTDLRHLNLVGFVIGVEFDRGAIGERSEKIPHRDRGVFAVGAAATPRSTPTLVVITPRRRLASNAGDA